jgi:preprotein translocase subunit SecG
MWLTRILTLVQLLSAGAIIGLVLLQRGKGADAGAGFGSGASGTVFGARGATTALSRATAIFAFIFMANSMGLAYLATRPATQAQQTLLDEAAVKSKSLPAIPVPATPGGAPGAVPSPAPDSTPAPATAPTPEPLPVPAPAPAAPK